MTGFFQRLKQRKLVQWAVAYVAAAFALLQGIDIVAQRFGWPEQTMRFVIIALSIGLFVTLVLAWYHGERGAQRVTGTELLILALLLALGGGFLWHFASGAREPAAKVVPEEKTTTTVSGIPAKSIAVLPFANLSHDPENAYFAAGIQDEIISRLSKIGELKVVSCTSTKRFKSSPDDVPAIARELAVANILEGSVQRTGDKVRVIVQLVKGDADTHLWAETFDRELNDIFAVESEIAKTIAGTLQAKLTGSEKNAIAAKPTENTEAYQLYLKGRFFWNKRTGKNLNKAADYFNQAVAVDPKYALAYVGLADSYVLMPLYGAATPKDCYPKAKAAAEKALALDDTLAEAHTSMGQVYCYSLENAKAIPEYERAVKLNPNYATGHHWYGSSGLTGLGRFDEAIAEVKRAIELDPLSLVINTDLGSSLCRARRYDEAIHQLRKTLEMDPDFYYAHWNLGLALEGKGASAAAIEEYLKARALTDDPSMLGRLGHAYATSGRKAEALKVRDELQEISGNRYVSAYTFAIICIGLGEKEEALRWLEKAYDDRAGDTMRMANVDFLLDPLRAEPRFKAIIKKIFPADAGIAESSQ